MVPEGFFVQMLGTRLADRYDLVKVLGSGGFGGVFAGHDRVLDRPVAVKILTPTLIGDSYAQRFQREARLLARLHHPNIVQVIDFGQHQSWLYLVMELVEGVPLTRVIEQGLPLPALRLVSLCDQILQALAEAHAQGIVHRDLKPDNILVVQRRDLSELVKMVDFGTATLIEPGDIFRTSDGHFYGTPAYMSPEQCRDGAVDARTDLYSFGCLLYQMLCGVPPFVAAGPLETLMAHALQEPVAPSARVKAGTVPAGLEHLALWCLSKQPDNRPASAETLRLELHRIAREGFVPPRLAPVVPGASPQGGASMPAGEGAGGRMLEPLPVPVLLVTPQPAQLWGVVEVLERLQTRLTVQRELLPTFPVPERRAEVGSEHRREARPLVLLDGQAPALERWCEQLRREQIPFSICGDEADIDAMARAVERGAHEFLPLPVSPVGLRRTLARMARVRR